MFFNDIGMIANGFIEKNSSPPFYLERVGSYAIKHYYETVRIMKVIDAGIKKDDGEGYPLSTDARIPAAFEAVRDKDEEILWVGQPEFVPFVATGIPFLIMGLLWGAIDYFGFIRHMGKGGMMGLAIPFFAIHLFPFYGSILNMLRLAMVHGNTRYAYTNKRLMMRSGFWGTDFKAIDYDRIMDLEVNVNPLENMYGVGTIRAFSGHTTGKGQRIFDQFIAVHQPYELFRRIKEISVDIKTDWNYPNALRPEGNPGYNTRYTPKG